MSNKKAFHRGSFYELENIPITSVFSFRRWFSWAEHIAVLVRADGQLRFLFFEGESDTIDLNSPVGTTSNRNSFTGQSVGDWAGTQDVFLNRWVEQHPDRVLRSNYFVYSTAGRRPRIMTGGDFERVNGFISPNFAINDAGSASKARLFDNTGTYGAIDQNGSGLILGVSAMSVSNAAASVFTINRQINFSAAVDTLRLIFDTRVQKRGTFMFANSIAYGADLINQETSLGPRIEVSVKRPNEIAHCFNGVMQTSVPYIPGDVDAMAGFVMGANSFNGTGMDGWITEIIVCQLTNHTDAEVIELSDYVNSYYNVY